MDNVFVVLNDQYGLLLFHPVLFPRILLPFLPFVLPAAHSARRQIWLRPPAGSPHGSRLHGPLRLPCIWQAPAPSRASGRGPCLQERQNLRRSSPPAPAQSPVRYPPRQSTPCRPDTTHSAGSVRFPSYALPRYPTGLP